MVKAALLATALVACTTGVPALYTGDEPVSVTDPTDPPEPPLAEKEIRDAPLLQFADAAP